MRLEYGLTAASPSFSNRGGLESVFKTAVISNGGAGGRTYNYYYDAFGRRRLKAYPLAGVTDEYFYDLGHQMLEDRGSFSPLSSAPYPEDDYVWLDGRPVAVVRGQLDANFARQPDSSASCSRLGDNVPCGIYFIVTDHIGKPVITLNRSGLLTGVYDYDPFGYLNRRSAQAETPHPYPNCMGSTDCTTASGGEIAEISQPPGDPKLAVKMRLRFHQVDTESAGATIYDFAQVRDGDTNACLIPAIGGHHLGQVVTDWFTPPGGRGHVKVSFRSDDRNFCPDGNGGLKVCGTAGCGPSCTGWPYNGVALESYDYQRYQFGLAAPLALPIRFPGQYYDPETDLHENWNRYYDPSIGRYLQPEPLLSRPGLGQGAMVGIIAATTDRDAAFLQLLRNAPSVVLAYAQAGRNLQSYAYALNNPISLIDGTDLGPSKPVVPGLTCHTTSDCECQRDPSSTGCTAASDERVTVTRDELINPQPQPPTTPAVEPPPPPEPKVPMKPGMGCKGAFDVCMGAIAGKCTNAATKALGSAACLAIYISCLLTGG